MVELRMPVVVAADGQWAPVWQLVALVVAARAAERMMIGIWMRRRVSRILAVAAVAAVVIRSVAPAAVVLLLSAS